MDLCTLDTLLASGYKIIWVIVRASLAGLGR